MRRRRGDSTTLYGMRRLGGHARRQPGYAVAAIAASAIPSAGEGPVVFSPVKRANFSRLPAFIPTRSLVTRMRALIRKVA
jgi:hypothetical protein